VIGASGRRDSGITGRSKKGRDRREKEWKSYNTTIRGKRLKGYRQRGGGSHKKSQKKPGCRARWTKEWQREKGKIRWTRKNCRATSRPSCNSPGAQGQQQPSDVRKEKGAVGRRKNTYTVSCKGRPRSVGASGLRPLDRARFKKCS